MNMTKLELVRGIQLVLSDESKWCKYAPARDVQGHETRVGSIHSVSFCIYGAARKAAGLEHVGQLDFVGKEGSQMQHFWEVLADIGQYNPFKVSDGSIAHYNDRSTYAEIMQRLKEVEAKYLAEEQASRPAMATEGTA